MQQRFETLQLSVTQFTSTAFPKCTLVSTQFDALNTHTAAVTPAFNNKPNDTVADISTDQINGTVRRWYQRNAINHRSDLFTRTLDSTDRP